MRTSEARMSFMTGVFGWGLLLLCSDLFHFICVGNILHICLVAAHLPLVAILALMPLPEDEVRTCCPFGASLVPWLRGSQDLISRRAPCLSTPRGIAALAIYIGWAAVPRATRDSPVTAFRGPLERLCGPFSYLWPAFSLLSFGFGVFTCVGQLSCQRKARHWLR
mmetsp:Transcript_39336/g.58601  ORF Transcript_39336/g.58601 Transcript_39336/m.58601 type:complete len:165 (-) Transcript_39336:3-497(-)